VGTLKLHNFSPPRKILLVTPGIFHYFPLEKILPTPMDDALFLLQHDVCKQIKLENHKQNWDSSRYVRSALYQTRCDTPGSCEVILFLQKMRRTSGELCLLHGTKICEASNFTSNVIGNRHCLYRVHYAIPNTQIAMTIVGGNYKHWRKWGAITPLGKLNTKTGFPITLQFGFIILSFSKSCRFLRFFGVFFGDLEF